MTYDKKKQKKNKPWEVMELPKILQYHINKTGTEAS